MLTTPARVYRETRKKHDQLFNVYVMRPLAAVVVAAVHRTGVTPNQVTLAQPGRVPRRAPALLRRRCPPGRGGSSPWRCSRRATASTAPTGCSRASRSSRPRRATCSTSSPTSSRRCCSSGALAVRDVAHGRATASTRACWDAGDARFLLAGDRGGGRHRLGHLAHQLRAQPGGQRSRGDAWRRTTRRSSRRGASARWSRRSCGSSNHYPSHIWLWALAGRHGRVHVALDRAQPALSRARVAGARAALRAGVSDARRGCSCALLRAAARARRPRGRGGVDGGAERTASRRHGQPWSPRRPTRGPRRRPWPSPPATARLRRSRPPGEAQQSDAAPRSSASPLLRSQLAQAAGPLRQGAPAGPSRCSASSAPAAGRPCSCRAPDESDPIVLALDRDRLLFAKDHPVAGITPPVLHLTLAPAPERGVALFAYVATMHLVAARMWADDGNPFAETSRCSTPRRATRSTWPTRRRGLDRGVLDRDGDARAAAARGPDLGVGPRGARRWGPSARSTRERRRLRRALDVDALPAREGRGGRPRADVPVRGRRAGARVAVLAVTAGAAAPTAAVNASTAAVIAVTAAVLAVTAGASASTAAGVAVTAGATASTAAVVAVTAGASASTAAVVAVTAAVFASTAAVLAPTAAVLAVPAARACPGLAGP